MSPPTDLAGLPAGREQDLARLNAELDAARARGGMRLVQIRGPAGMGKTHFLAAAALELRRRGALVVEGAGSRGSQKPYLLFAEPLRQLLHALRDLGVPPRAVSELRLRLGPVLGGTAGAPVWIDLCDALAETVALATRARGTGLALVLDEADAADPASLELLRYLCTALAAPGACGPVVLVVAFRDGVPLPLALVDVAQRIPATTIPLAPLDLDGVRDYLKARAERVLAETGGVPDQIEALLAAPAGETADLFLRRIDRLEGEDQKLLAALAALGRPSTAAEIGDAAGLGGDGLAARLDGLAAARLLAAREDASAADGAALRYEFTRASDRDALLPRVPPALFAAAGEALQKSGAPAEEVARAFLRGPAVGGSAAASGAPDLFTVRAREWAVRAGDALASRLAFEAAEEMFRRALDRSGAPRDTASRAGIYRRLADLARARGDAVASLRWLGLYRRDGAGEAGLRAARAEAASLCLQLGKVAAAEHLCALVLAGAASPDPGDPIAVRAWADLCETALLKAQYDRAEALCDAGLHAAPGTGDAAVRVKIRNTLGKSHLARGEWAKASKAFAENAREAAEAQLHGERARALLNLGVVAHRAGDRKAALARYREAMALDERGAATIRAHAAANLSALFHETGEIEKALEHGGRALTAFTRAGRREEASRAAQNLARLHIYLGDAPRAAELSEHALRIAQEVKDPYLHAGAALVRAEARELAGDAQALAEARDGYREAARLFDEVKSPRYGIESRLLYARLARDAKPLREAEALGALSLGCGAELKLVAAEIALESVAGPAGASASDAALLDAAEAALAQARDLLGDHPELESPVRLCWLAGRVRHARGDAAGAEAQFARGARLLDDLAAQVPPERRAQFLARPRRRAVLEAASGAFTPQSQARALRLASAESSAAASDNEEIAGNSPALKKVLALLDRVARSSATVLLRGESGTGKELIAEAIHRKSDRRDMPLVKLNCGALNEELLLSELFGHEKGAFTGAVRERKGRFEMADGGTLFLDEIGDITAKAQVALLRVLQEREFERVGGIRTLKVDVRVICATHRDLEQMMREGRFREDLYYRLKGVMLQLPALRERVEDIPVLIDRYLRRHAREQGEGKKSFSPEATELLLRYPWPGNVRELENIVRSAALLAHGEVISLEGGAFETHPEITAGRRAAPTAPPPAPSLSPARDSSVPAVASATQPAGARTDAFGAVMSEGLREYQHRVEVECIARALDEAAGNISEAARLLKMKRSRLSQIVNGEPELRSRVKGTGVA